MKKGLFSITLLLLQNMFSLTNECFTLMIKFRTYYAEVAHNVKRKTIVERVAQLEMVVTKQLARLRNHEDE